MTNFNTVNMRGCKAHTEGDSAAANITSGQPGRVVGIIADTNSTDDVAITFYDATTAAGTDSFAVTVKGSSQLVAEIPGWSFSTGLSTTGGTIQRMTIFYILT